MSEPPSESEDGSDFEGPRLSRSRMFARGVEIQHARLREREVRAAERAARWAFGSMVVSLFALAVALWPVVRDLFQ